MKKVLVFIIVLIQITILAQHKNFAQDIERNTDLIIASKDRIWNFDRPRGIAVDKSGNVYVVDTDNGCIRKFSQEGEELKVIGSLGFDEGQLSLPWSAAIDDSGNIYTVDWNSCRILKFNSEGVFLKSWGNIGEEEGQFYLPEGVAVDGKGNIYVADTHNHRIQRFNSEGVFLKSWGSKGEGAGQFNYPAGIALDRKGDIYVVDSSNYRIQKFNSKGTFLKSWQGYGADDDLPAELSGIAIDIYGNVYVTDINNIIIEKFNSEGLFLGSWGSGGDKYGEFRLPLDVCVDKKGNIYVGDTYNHRIQKFDSRGNYLSSWGVLGDSFFPFEPKGMAIDGAGNIYVADMGKQRVVKFNSEGDLLNSWDGDETKHFTCINDVAVDKEGNVYVAELDGKLYKFNSKGVYLDLWQSTSSNALTDHWIAVNDTGNIYVSDKNSIKILNSEGEFLSSFEKANTRGVYNNFIDVEIDGLGNIYITNEVGEILKYNQNGKLLINIFGSKGYNRGQFNSPFGLFVSKTGIIYVADTQNNRIQVINPTISDASTPTPSPIQSAIPASTQTPTSKTTVIPPTSTPYPVAMDFKDIEEHWAKESMLDLANKGIICGYEDGTIKPDNHLTRNEAVKVLAKIMDLETSNNAESELILEDEPLWAIPYIKATANSELIKGYEDKKFRGKNYITRAEATTIFVKALSLSNIIDIE